MFNLKKIHPATYLLPKDGDMIVPGLVIANQEIIQSAEIEKPLEQVRNVATLPGILGYSVAMPDIHWGYGFPIGGVAAMDAEKGVISPGGVGYDINCGVRLALVPLAFKSINEKTKKKLLEEIFRTIPSGVGHGHQNTERSLNNTDYHQLVQEGAAWSISRGYGFNKDISYMESNGFIEGADIEAVSEQAKFRGRDQLGSIGSGNHFVEIGEVQTLFDPIIAAAWGIEVGQTYILIHSGSRGFGYQICQDTLDAFIKKGFANGLIDKQLVSAPINSPEGKQYFCAMSSAANYAFNNRQQILHFVRQAFFNICGISPESIPLVYDVCHNIAKFENHIFEGSKRKVCVHRKGATRAFGPNSPELAPVFQSTGQPVLVPGDMGRASYVMAGLGNTMTWCSACHGAGRARSRVQSMKLWKGKHPIEHMQEKGVLVMASSYKTIAEEMPDAYKDVDTVVEAVEEANMAKRIARLRPGLVLKG